MATKSRARRTQQQRSPEPPDDPLRPSHPAFRFLPRRTNGSVMETSPTTDHRAAPSLSGEDKRRIERVARCVARDRDGDLTDKLLRRLLGITRNGRRWGFLSPEHPLHTYYLQQKVSERCRILRPRAAADR